ncbi:MAG: GTP-binding protein [Candidatus Lokiarchaeota archaeon]|nr:GTP-binding protein [Candidatus Lokiarchaeota archaeon]
MPKGQIEKIKLISKFLDKTKVINFDKLDTMDSVLNLPISAFNFLSDADVDLIYKLFQISSISQFSSLDPAQPFVTLYKDKKTKKKIEHLLQADLEIEDKVKKAVIISNVIYKIKEESISFLKKEQKVVVVGLSNAGKTTILKKFGGEIGIRDLAKLSPTRGVDRQEIITSDILLLIWDFGGQEEYREMYLKDPNKYFLKVDLIIYVIDLQDPEKYNESIQYFDKIIDIIEKLEENPYILIFIHKYDPDLKDNPELLLNIEYVKDLIKNIFRGRKKLDYDIYLSSIYSLLAKGPKFSRYLKETMQKTATLSDYKLEGMASILESTLNGIIQLSEVVMEQFNELDSRMSVIEGGKTTPKTSLSSIPTPEYTTTLPFTSHSSKADQKKVVHKRERKVREAVLDELKELLKKRK